MSDVTVTIIDQTANTQTDVTVPNDRPVHAITAKLVEGMNLPTTGPDGEPLSYKLHHKASGKQLSDEQTFASAGVQDGDLLRLQPEITAGGVRPRRGRGIAAVESGKGAGKRALGGGKGKGNGVLPGAKG